MTVCFSAVPVKLMLKCSHYGTARSKLNVTIFRDSTCSQFDGVVHREKLLFARLQTNFRLTLITQVRDPVEKCCLRLQRCWDCKRDVKLSVYPVCVVTMIWWCWSNDLFITSQSPIVCPSSTQGTRTRSLLIIFMVKTFVIFQLNFALR